jgi:chemotaxis signal transduction protein
VSLDEEITDAERRVLEHRAHVLQSQPAEEKDQAWVAQFELGGRRYALPLECLRATLPLRAVTFIPLSDAHVLGILRFQGQIISALSLASLLGNPGWRVDPTVLVVVDLGWGTPVALDCEQVPKVVAVSKESLALAQAPGSGLLTHLELSEGQPVELIDPRHLLDRRGEARRAG